MSDEPEDDCRKVASSPQIIADRAGDPRAAVIELPAIVRSLIAENLMLREASSPEFERRRPIVFGVSGKGS